LIWTLPVIDQSNAEGSLEFSVRGKANDFFPVQVDFASETPFCDIRVRTKSKKKQTNKSQILFSFYL